MKNKYLIIFTAIFISLTSCKEEQKFPVDKKYWDTKDYENVINEIKFNSKPEEKLPTFNDSDSRLVLEKLTDENNFKVVLDDKELGINHRSEIAEKFFEQWRAMNGLYTEIDRTDKYIYEKEMIEIWNFGLELQIKYFKVGNDAIKEKSDDPNSESTKNLIDSNTNILVSNMLIFLDEINKENSYSSIGLDLISEGIDKNFTELIKIYPDFNYERLLNKVNLMLKKTKSEAVKQSLIKVKSLIEVKK